MRGTLCHHLCSWNVLGAVWQNVPNTERSIMKFLCHWNSLELEFALQTVLSFPDYRDVKGRWRRWKKAEQNETEIWCWAPFVNLNPDVKRQDIILQKVIITKPITPINELSHTCKRFISSGFSEPGTLSFNIDDMTLTFIFAISSSLYSFPICWNATGEYCVGEQSKQNNSYL